MRLIITNRAALREAKTYQLVLMRNKLKWYNFRLLRLVSEEFEGRLIKDMHE